MEQKEQKKLKKPTLAERFWRKCDDFVVNRLLKERKLNKVEEFVYGNIFDKDECVDIEISPALMQELEETRRRLGVEADEREGRRWLTTDYRIKFNEEPDEKAIVLIEKFCKIAVRTPYRWTVDEENNRVLDFN